MAGVDDISRKYSGNAPQQWGKAGRTDFRELPGDEAPSYLYDAFDRFNNEVYGGKLERIPIRTNVPHYISETMFVEWCGDADLEFMSVHLDELEGRDPHGPEFYDLFAKIMSYVSHKKQPEPEPSPSWLHTLGEMIGHVTPEAAEAATEQTIEPSAAAVSVSSTAPAESSHVPTYRYEPMSDSEAEFEDVPSTARAVSVGEPIAQLLTIAAPVAPPPSAPVSMAARCNPPRRHAAAPQALARPPSRAGAVNVQIAPTAPPEMAELLALAHRFVAHLDDAAARREAPAQYGAEPLTVSYSSPRPARQAPRQVDPTLAKIAALYAAASPAGTLPAPARPAQAQPHLLALPRPMERSMQPIFTGEQRRVTIPGRSGNGK